MENGMERKLTDATDQLGILLLDMMLVSLKKIHQENEIIQGFADARNGTKKMPTPF